MHVCACMGVGGREWESTRVSECVCDVYTVVCMYEKGVRVCRSVQKLMESGGIHHCMYVHGCIIIKK